MPGCAAGAKPKAGLTSETVLLLLGSGLIDLVSHANLIFPPNATNYALGRVAVSQLCTDNPVDPGPPSAQDLAWTATNLVALLGGNPGLGYGSWLWKQAYYHYFQANCDCIDTSLPPPARVPVPPPSAEPPYPTPPQDQEQLKRIEDNSAPNNAGLTTIYNGVMELNAQVGDLSWYQRPNFVGSGGDNIGSISGEGQISLLGANPHGEFLTGDWAGVRTTITSLPTKYKVRGTVTPRYYGIGSIMWITSDAVSGIDVISKRESIHYINQFSPMPPMAFHPRLAYRLMPGAVATVSVVTRSITGAWYGNQGWDQRALLQLSADVPPSTFTDPPFYPKSATTYYSLPAASPP